MVEGDRGRPPDRRESPLAGDDAAAAAEIAAVFRSKLAGLRWRLRPADIPAAVRALKADKQMALKALRDRREADRFSRRLEKRRLQPPPLRPP